jgi:Cys-tRNA(Pro)/Cys-tRNA(Cys) deacylase
MQAARALGVEPARPLKTLMARGGRNTVCVLIPSAAKSASSSAPLPPAARTRSCGLPPRRLSCRRHLAIRTEKRRGRGFFAQHALAHPTVGWRGLQIEIAPGDLVPPLNARPIGIG